MALRTSTLRETEKLSTTSEAYRSYISRVTDRNGKFLRRNCIGITFGFSIKIQQIIRSSKVKKKHISPAGIYRISCSYHKVYIGTTKKSMQTRLKEHEASFRLGHIGSTEAEYNLG